MDAKFTLDRSKSLEELENEVWQDVPAEDKTPLIGRALQLRRKPLNQFSEEDLRFMIGQEIGLNYLVVMAIEVLSENPLAQGIYYEGDLLSSILTVNPKFWQEHPQLWWEVEEIVYNAELIVQNFREKIVPEIKLFREVEPKMREVAAQDFEEGN